MSVVVGERAAAVRSGPGSRLGFGRREAAVIGGLLALGAAIRLWVGFTNFGATWDVDSAYIVAYWLTWHPLHVYMSNRYPYPGGFLPVILICKWVADATGAAFYGVFKVPSILADIGIAAALAWGLERFGAGARERLITVALVALGPSFILISGYHGQIDACAILPALVAVIVWRLGGEQRAWQAGLLIGLGASVKTVPLFMVLALLPTVRSWREAAILIACAVAVPALSLLPFAIANWHYAIGWQHENKGAPGIGGLGLLIQPSLLNGWLHDPQYLAPWTHATVLSLRYQNYIVGAAALLAGAYAFRARMDPVTAAVLIWLVVYVANANWAFQYFIWGLPFFLLAGRRREVAVLQLLLVLPAAEFYFGFAAHSLRWLYIPIMTLVWCAFLAAAVNLITRHRPSPALA
jgi:hypothetical protein